MPNKLLIKANFCDLRNVKEETLAAYDVIEVRANVVVLNDRARELIARYPVTLKCDLATDNPNIALRSVNGVAEVTPGDGPEADTVLTVNGELKIASGSAEVLARYLQITVNGQVYCPRSLSGKLGNVVVNGQIITWPDGAVQLKNTAVLDSTFALRAKPALYWAARCVVMLDPALDAAALAKQGVRFDTPRAILAQSLATQAAPLFEDDTNLEIVPDGTAYLKDDAELTAALIRRKGNKLYVDGRLTLTAESAALLPQLELRFVRQRAHMGGGGAGGNDKILSHGGQRLNRQNADVQRLFRVQRTRQTDGNFLALHRCSPYAAGSAVLSPSVVSDAGSLSGTTS